MSKSRTERTYRDIITKLVAELKDDFINEGCEETLKVFQEVNYLLFN